jgi:hypothetical protein
MSRESDYSKKYWWLGLIVVPLVAAVIGIIPNLLNNRGQKPFLPEREPPISSHALKTQERVIDEKTEEQTRKTKSTPPMVQPPSKTPDSVATPKSIQLSKNTAILIVENENRIDWTFGTTIAKLLKKQGIRITTPSLFNHSFLTSGDFDRLFSGSSRKTDLAQLPQHFKSGVFGKKTITYAENTNFTDIITATMTLELHVVSSQSGTIKMSILFTQNGAGFSNADASKTAEERIIKELKIKLPAIFNHLGK